MQCVILAAGSGSRLSSLCDAKPLLPVLGVPLIERNIRNLAAAGISEFIVVTGHAADRVDAFLRDLAARLGLPIRCVHNPDWASAENGRSVLAAEKAVHGPFVLAMGDHLAEPGLVRQLIDRAGDETLSLAVDRRLDNPHVDLGDVTRVRCGDIHVEAIGKKLIHYDGWDTGFFFCRDPQAFFAAIRRACGEGESSLSDAVERLAAAGEVRAVDIGDHYWNDIDSPRQLEFAERWLLDLIGGKTRDGPVARHLNRPLSLRLSRLLAALPVTPNQISITSFVLCLIAAGLMASGSAKMLILGGLLAQFASVLDGCDGEIARLKYQASDYGGWLDAVLDRYGDAALILGLTWALAPEQGNMAWLLGSLALAGSFMASYTADKYDGWASREGARRWRMGRDLRIFLIALGAVTGWIVPVLLLIAVLMNGEAIRRAWILRPGT